MVLPGLGGLDTPRTNVGDATYLSRAPDFDISQEASFQSPGKDGGNDIFAQLRNGGGKPSLRTPRRGGTTTDGRAPFASRQNLPEGIGGVEFTPMLKSVTRNSARRYSGKENSKAAGAGAVPFSLDRIAEDYNNNHDDDGVTPRRAGGTTPANISSYGASRNSSYVENTPLPQIDSSSIVSTPMATQLRRSRMAANNKDANGNGNGNTKANGPTADPLQDGNQLSLREQENVIDRIEKENFGLKLKIHFLEEGLRKAGPGFSEAALKENTELKVDKVTLQRDLQRYKKLVVSAEHNLETYRQDMQDMQEKMAKRKADEGLRAEMDQLRDALAAKDEELAAKDDEIANLQKVQQDELEDLEADLREKDRLVSQKEDELEDLQLSMASRMEENRQRIQELEEQAVSTEKLDEAKETIENLEADIRRLELQADDMKEKLEEAVTERQRAEEDLEELQEEMANKSVHTKGLSRQVEEKVARLQGDVDKAQQECARLQTQQTEQQHEAEELKQKLKESRQARDEAERATVTATSQLKEAQADLNMVQDQKALLQMRHDALATESTTLQRDVGRLEKMTAQLEADLEQERQHSLDIEHDLQTQYRDELARLNRLVENQQTEIREKEHLYDIDSDKWDMDRQHLEAERDRLQQTIDRLRAAEGALSGKEAQLQELLDSEKERHEADEALLKRQLESLQKQLATRQETLDGLRKELATVREQLRTTQNDSQERKDQIERLEDKIESLNTVLADETDKVTQTRRDLEDARDERDQLQRQLDAALRSGNGNAEAASAAASAAAAAAATANQQQREDLNKMRAQLAESTGTLAAARKEKQNLQDQLANTNVELHSLRASLTETRAERDEMEEQLRQTRQQEGETVRLDQERIDLRTTKMKLDGEVRRLREENRSLSEQCETLEKTLEDELDKAANEEERLGQEIRQLQSMRVRTSAVESQELQAARRTIRDLELRIQELEVMAEEANQNAVANANANANNNDNTTTNLDNAAEIAGLRRDLVAARTKERDYLQREAAHKDAIKTLRRQIADLERAAHEAEISRLMGSPTITDDLGSVAGANTSSAAQKAEIVQLREQLTTAHQTANQLKRTLRETERQAAANKDLEARIKEAEEERNLLEQALDEAEEAAAEAQERHEAALRKIQSKLERYRREREELALALADAQQQQQQLADQNDSASELSREERSNLHAMLRKTQVEAESLERQLREHRSALDDAHHAEDTLRSKLERARNDRAVFRAEAERLQREMDSLRRAQTDLRFGTTASQHGTREIILAAQEQQQHQQHQQGPDTDALVRAAEEQSIRHRKQMRGLEMQIQWMQARWEREARLRNGAALGKQLVAQDLEMRIACNNADLKMLQGILRQLGMREPVLPSSKTLPATSKTAASSASRSRPTLRQLAIAVRFVIRARNTAQAWSKQEATRQRLAAASESVLKAERMQQMRAAWRVQLAEATAAR